jgi:dihydrofolate reductase
MGKVFLDITTSLDGYVAGPNPTLEQPLGVGGERLHEWMIATATFRETHGQSGGERSADSEVFQELVDSKGASVMGRRMFSGGQGPWADDPKAGGWWGEDPPFRQPVFVLTHHAREPLVLGETTFTFVTEGVEAAVELARAAAGDKDVAVIGGAAVAQEALAAGLVDELNIHVSPVFLGSGTRLFDDGAGAGVQLELDGAIDSPAVTHLRYRVVR